MTTTQKHEKRTKTSYRDLVPGSRVVVGGVEFAVLSVRPDDSIFVVAVNNQFSCQFGMTGNYITSQLRENVHWWLIGWMEDNGIDPKYILPRTLNLRTMNFDYSYGQLETKAAPLTLDEMRVYAEFIPDPDDGNWLATGWYEFPFGLGRALVSFPADGLGYYKCANRYGVRPALVLSSKLFLADADAQDDHKELLCTCTTRELLDELNRRCGEE